MIIKKWMHLKCSVRQRNGIMIYKALLRLEREVRWDFWRILRWVIGEGCCGDLTVSRDEDEMSRRAVYVAGMRVFQEEESQCKGPGVGMSLGCIGKSKEAKMTGME